MMMPGLIESYTLDRDDYILIAGIYLLVTLWGVRQILRDRRLHYVGRMPDAVYRASIVEAMFPTVFLPVFIIVDRTLGGWGSLALGFIGIAIGVWADETRKHPEV